MDFSVSSIPSKKFPDFQNDSATGRLSFSWRALGSPCSVQVYNSNQSIVEQFRREAIGWLNHFEEKYSRFKPTSLISQINAQAGEGWVDIDPETEALFALCDSLSFKTHGVLDPTSLPLIQFWYKATEVPSAQSVEAAKALVGWHEVEREPGRVRLPKKGMAIDFGGFGKEYAVDQLATIGDRLGLSDYLIDLGRDMRVKGTPSGQPCWHVAVEDPNQVGKPLLGVGLSGGAVAASGDYRNFFISNGTRYGHIVDPKTGYPVSNQIRAVHVLASTCLEAGIHSTSAFILGIPDGLDLLEQIYGIEGLIITEDNQFKTKSFYQYVVS